MTNLFFSRIIVALLPFIPAAFAVRYTNQNPVITFAISFVAIIPLSGILDMVTEQLSIRRGGHEGLGIIVTVSNVVQLVITIIALVKSQSNIVQTSLVGAVISNSVLMVGIGFFLGGTKYTDQDFSLGDNFIYFNALTLSVIALIMPTAFKTFGPSSKDSVDIMAKISRAESVLLLVSYLCYLLFIYKSHKDHYQRPNRKGIRWKDINKPGDTVTSITQLGEGIPATMGDSPRSESNKKLLSNLSPRHLALTLVVDIAVLGFCTTFAVDSIDGLTQKTALEQSFVGLILLPILSCNFHALRLAYKDDMSLSFAITINSSVQLLLCVLPLAVMIGWIRGDPTMNLLFDPFQVSCLGVSILILRYIIDDGKSNWLEGVVLIVLYAIIALTAWFV